MLWHPLNLAPYGQDLVFEIDDRNSQLNCSIVEEIDMSRIMAVATTGLVIWIVSKCFRHEQSRGSNHLDGAGKRVNPNSSNKLGDTVILEKSPDAGIYRPKQ